RVLAPSRFREALAAPLGTQGSLPLPGACYPALRRLPRRDLHPLEKRSVKIFVPSDAHLRHDAPWRAVYRILGSRAEGRMENEAETILRVEAFARSASLPNLGPRGEEEALLTHERPGHPHGQPLRAC